MIDRRTPGTADVPSRPPAAPRPSVPVPTQPRLGPLVEHLERVRAAYRDGRATDAERECRELTRELDRAVQATKRTTPRLHALAGATATLRGLAGLLAGGRADADTFDVAVRHFEAAHRLVAERGDLSADYGIALAMNGDPHQARAVLARAISLGEDSPDVRRVLATTLLAEGKPGQAFDALHAAVDRAPNDWQAYRALAGLAERLDRPPAETAAIWLGTGRALLAGGRPDDATAAFERAGELSPNLGADDESMFAKALVQSGRSAEALPHLRAAAAAARAAAELVSIAELLVELGEPAEAETLARAALAAEPGQADVALALSQTLLAQGKMDDARETVLRLLATSPNDTRGHLLLGIVDLNAGMAADAVGALRAADRLEPGHPQVLAYLGVALAESGAGLEALASLDSAVALTPRDPWIRWLRGRVRFTMQELPAAEDDLRVALELAPDQPRVRALLGELLRLRGAYDEAEAELDRALAEDPGIEWAWAPRAELFARRGNWASASDAFHRALAHDPHLLPTLTGLANALLESGQASDLVEAEQVLGTALRDAPESAEAHALIGEVRRRQERFDEALASFDKAIALSADYTYALASRGGVLLQIDRIDEAIAALEDADRTGAEPAFVNARLGEAYLSRFESGDGEAVHEAVRFLRKAVRAAPDDPGLFIQLGQALLFEGKDAKALKQLDQAVRLLEQEPAPAAEALGAALMLRGQAALGTGDPHAAITDLRMAIELGDDRPDVRALYAQAFYQEGSVERALADAERVLETDDRHPVALAVRGAARVELDELDRGIADLRAALDIEPTQPFATRQLRAALDRAGRPGDAVEALRSALDHAPDDGTVRLEYAKALVVAREYRLAVNELEELQWDVPANAELYRLYGRALAAIGRRRDAVTALQRALDLSGDRETAIALASRQAGIGEFTAALSTLAGIKQQNAVVLTARAYVLADMDQWAAAADTARAATNCADAGRGAYCALGWALQHGETADASGSVAAFTTAVELDPDDPWAHKGLANALYLDGDHDEAMAEYEWVEKHLVTISPRDPYRNGLRGWCLYRLGHFFAAVDHLQRAVEDPDLRVGALFDLVLARLGLGDDAHTMATWRLLTEELGSPSRPRGKYTVGADNLRAAVKHELADRPLARTLLAELTSS